MAQLEEELTICHEQIEKLCEKGQIEDGEAMMKQVEKLESEKKQLSMIDTGEYEPTTRNKFTVCEICGVFQAITDVMCLYSVICFFCFCFLFFLFLGVCKIHTFRKSAHCTLKNKQQKCYKKNQKIK